MQVLVAIALVLAAQPALAAGFSLKSADLEPNGKLAESQVYNGFGCQGGNVSPQLAWSNAPAGTKSFVVTAYDPDAPTGSGWWHWLVFDLPADVHELARGAGSGAAALPAGATQGKTDFGSVGYGGACPPPGKPHRYIFTVYALKIDKLGVPADASAALIGFTTRANVLAKASVTVKYGRKK
jgi:Raf kinase inhibitor-like YbhB/YbcL family protein